MAVCLQLSGMVFQEHRSAVQIDSLPISMLYLKKYYYISSSDNLSIITISNLKFLIK